LEGLVVSLQALVRRSLGPVTIAAALGALAFLQYRQQVFGWVMLNIRPVRARP